MRVEKLLLIALFLFGIGCSDKAILEDRPQSVANSKYAPTNGSKLPGIVSYDKDDEEMEEDAYKKMYETCNGKYRITDRDVTKIVYDEEDDISQIFGPSYRVHLKFVCE